MTIRLLLMAAAVCLCGSSCTVLSRDALSAVGREAPNARLDLVDEGVVRLDSFKGKGVVLCFWDTTCPYAGTALSSCRNWAEKYPAAEVEFIAVGLDDEELRDNWQNKISKLDKSKLRHAFSGNGAFDEAYVMFKLNVLPSFVFIDSQGIVRALSWRAGAIEQWLPDSE
jgi:alkyl hydroperoxide reductase subunit AhpC